MNKIVSKGGDKIMIPSVELTLLNGEVILLESTTWDMFIDELNDDKTYIEQSLIHLFNDDKGDQTFLVMKNQIVMAKLLEKKN
ncbi:hypothetical protein [Exiguobacterium sp. SH0S7]|uniref:hypothetical protein n=1 Tax=Exiguobacterium sp. SH0S7 TaxID=2510951 RepID=UPI0013155FBD|nr:hypothetical protein [Exiguobacterium sp. SH0S7]